MTDETAMSDIDIAELRRLLAERGRGEWERMIDIKNAVPELLDRLERAEAERDSLLRFCAVETDIRVSTDAAKDEYTEAAVFRVCEERDTLATKLDELQPPGSVEKVVSIGGGDIEVWSDGHAHTYSPTSRLRDVEAERDELSVRCRELQEAANFQAESGDEWQVAANVIRSLTAERDELARKLAAAKAAMIEADEVLGLCVTRSFSATEDKVVAALCEKMGYGAFMSAASKTWSDKTRTQGFIGAQHTCGPCESTVTSTRAKLKEAIDLTST